jgi:endonuclease YncB( thermonuclease family)
MKVYGPILCLALLFAANEMQAAFASSVTRILDGDTIEVLHNNRPERIRLSGIDCPEKGQAYGMKAKQATSDLVFGKDVTLETHGTDKYGRTIADVSLPDGIHVNLELVRNGWCWWYQKYAPDNVILAELQRRARRSGLGLWADPNPVPPWEWRKPNPQRR